MLWLLLLFVAVGAIFWYNQYQYSLPTTVPSNYHAVSSGTAIKLPVNINAQGKPVFLHFFNPDCPCSRFNIAHVKTLIDQYGTKAFFVVVLVTQQNYTAQYIQQKFGLNVPVIRNDALALACGVYATPQAAILTSQHQLYYRGNYNSNRYCTDTKTQYARLALDAMLSHLPAINNPKAATAYGCRLALTLNNYTYGNK